MADFDYDTTIHTGRPITLDQSHGPNNNRDADGQPFTHRSVRQSIYSESDDHTSSNTSDQLTMSVNAMRQNTIKRIDELGWRLHDVIWHPDRMENGPAYSRRDTPLPTQTADDMPARPAPKTVMRAYLRAQEATAKQNVQDTKGTDLSPLASDKGDSINEWYHEREKLQGLLPKLQTLLANGINSISVDPNRGIYASVDHEISHLSQSQSSTPSDPDKAEHQLDRAK